MDLTTSSRSPTLTPSMYICLYFLVWTPTTSSLAFESSFLEDSSIFRKAAQVSSNRWSSSFLAAVFFPKLSSIEERRRCSAPSSTIIRAFSSCSRFSSNSKSALLSFISSIMETISMLVACTSDPREAIEDKWNERSGTNVVTECFLKLKTKVK
ncbi:sporangia induced deflagellation-inducible protein [Strigomonas culicis]|uniref:Sporangia induced deflagellation-inducible protein n=1 Tax=Strigomonas culicis TaxID=28005 RepID=S9ULW3_9TRYP|nr:sporangia induced deflagellation-inducible protein [Strigomonas culicis]|eukprot:EPY31837.1 sporangia induced deflagellation-inducible protein [Strigomonas culicis]